MTPDRESPRRPDAPPTNRSPGGSDVVRLVVADAVSDADEGIGVRS